MYIVKCFFFLFCEMEPKEGRRNNLKKIIKRIQIVPGSPAIILKAFETKM